MSLFSPQFQILSDLHLETPFSKPLYTTYLPPIHAHTLFLLGDIGLVRDAELFAFLTRLLRSSPVLKVFYVLGNHEPYGITIDQAVNTIRAFETRTKANFGDRFIFLHRNRHDYSPAITILGCALWTHVDSSHKREIHSRMTDFNPQRGIRDWSLESHNAEHAKDLQWLNDQVRHIAEAEPERQIVILTHHSPTMDPRANDPVHRGSSMQQGFVTDLSKEVCWTCPNVKLWAFGHTHYCCRFYDERGKLVVSNAKGYSGPGDDGSRFEQVVVEAVEGKWTVVPMEEMEAAVPKRKGRFPERKVQQDVTKGPEKKTLGLWGLFRGRG